MDDKKMLKDLMDWQSNTQDMFDNFGSFVEKAKGSLTPEEKKMVDEKMNSIDISEVKKEIGNIEKKINDAMAKMNG